MAKNLSHELSRVRVPALKAAERRTLQSQFRTDAQGWWLQRTSASGFNSLMIGAAAEFTCILTQLNADGSVTTSAFWRGDNTDPVVLVEDRPGDHTQLRRVAPFAETKRIPTKACKRLKAGAGK